VKYEVLTAVLSCSQLLGVDWSTGSDVSNDRSALIFSQAI